MRVRRQHRSLRKRRGVSELVATLLLIAIAVAAALVFFSFALGLFGHLTSGGGPSSLVTATGGLTVPGSTSTSGILTINVRNGNSQPITAVTLACESPPFSTVNCNGLVIDYGGNPISVVNPIPLNQLGSGSGVVSAFVASPFVAGTTYTVELHGDVHERINPDFPRECPLDLVSNNRACT